MTTCDICGTDRCDCRPKRSPFLEALGFTDAPHAVRRRRRPEPPPPAVPVPTTVGTPVPTRSTTGLVQELWAADDSPAPPFPPPIEPAIAGTRRLGWVRIVATVLVLGLVGATGYLGTGWWLDQRSADLRAEAATALDETRAVAADVPAAIAAVTDADTGAVDLSAAATTITDLGDRALRLSNLSQPPANPLAPIGVDLTDPLETRRVAFGVVADRAIWLSDGLSTALATRLRVAQLPALPELPAGADDGTVEAVQGALIDVVEEVRDAVAASDPALADRLEPAVAQLDAAVADYVVALRSDDPAAEAHAAEIESAFETTRAGAVEWLASQADRLTADSLALDAALDGIGG